ncbi:MAG TPA: alpha/beta hydrolase [Solirubrobacteraceae bacterium]|jgi:acetyl esterase|nr:alpha/beta hydrolase [Solirubrobacteraceae bacterium]
MSPRLDPEAQALLEVMRAAGAPQPYVLPVEQAREQMRAAFITKGQSIALHSVEDIFLPTLDGTLDIRLFRPADGVLPVALFLHGGGWTLNDLDTHDRLCRRIALRSGWLIAALDYRRAPEHKHPAALEDAHWAYRWLLDNGAQIGADAATVALVGESSGATTVASLTLLLRDLGARLPVLQVLVYPLVDGSSNWSSYEDHGSGYTLDREFVRWSLDNYVPAGHDLTDPYLLPLAASDHSGLSPALVMTAEFDPLRDEGIAYARALARAGVAVEHVHAEDQMHSFLLLDRAVSKAGALIDRLADALAVHRS